MLRNILLLTPIYISAFWTIILNLKDSEENKAKKFMGKFMAVTTILYLAHFIYFSQQYKIYTFIDPFYQLAMLLVYPLFFIYVRLLMVDAKFSLSKHAKFLLAPLVLFIFYCIGMLLTPFDEYKRWIINRSYHSAYLLFIKSIYVLIRIVFLVQVIYTVRQNFFLIKNYGSKARNYYADPEDYSTRKIRLLNIAMIITALSSAVLCILGREFFNDNNWSLSIASFIFSSSLFTIGYWSYQQKIINPEYEDASSETTDTANSNSPMSNSIQKDIVDKIETLFKEKHIYMHSKFNINDLARAVGTNRTYISFTINQTYGVNFSIFVNQHRIGAIERSLTENPRMSYEELATYSGFGSVDSMKRAVKTEYNQNFKDWKSNIVQKKT